MSIPIHGIILFIVNKIIEYIFSPMDFTCKQLSVNCTHRHGLIHSAICILYGTVFKVTRHHFVERLVTVWITTHVFFKDKVDSSLPALFFAFAHINSQSFLMEAFRQSSTARSCRRWLLCKADQQKEHCFIEITINDFKLTFLLPAMKSNISFSIWFITSMLKLEICDA